MNAFNKLPAAASSSVEEKKWIQFTKIPFDTFCAKADKTSLFICLLGPGPHLSRICFPIYCAASRSTMSCVTGQKRKIPGYIKMNYIFCIN